MGFLRWLVGLFKHSSSPTTSRTTTATTTATTSTAITTTSTAKAGTVPSSQVASSTSTTSASSQTKGDESTEPLQASTSNGIEETADGLSSGAVAGIVVSLTVITVIILLIVFIIRFRKNGVKQNMFEPSATNDPHRPTHSTTYKHEDKHHPGTTYKHEDKHHAAIDEHAYSRITTARSNEEDAVFDIPTVSDTANGHVTSDKDVLPQTQDKGTYFELENYPGTSFSHDDIDTYNRPRLDGNNRERDSAAGSNPVSYDHLPQAGHLPAQPPPQLSDHSNTDDYSQVCRRGDGGVDMRSVSTVEDTYHHLQQDDAGEYNRLRCRGDNVGNKHSACPGTDSYAHLQGPVHTSHTHGCDDYELAKVVSDSNYAEVS